MTPYGVFTPKHHICYHLIANTPKHGNPVAYANWLDEALNKSLKACCRFVSQRGFETSVLLRMRDILSRGHPPSKTAKRRRSRRGDDDEV